MGNTDILQEILSVGLDKSNIDIRNEKGETALFKAISNNQLNALKLLLVAGSSIEVETSDKDNVFHVAAKHGKKDVLEYLLKYNSEVTAKLINKCDSEGPPLVCAVSENHLICAKLLIRKGAKVNAACKIDGNTSTLLHLAARKNHCKIAEMIIENDSETVYASNSARQTPLYEACYHGNREMIVLLLSKGADLSGVGINGFSTPILTPIDILMHNVSKPTSQL